MKIMTYKDIKEYKEGQSKADAIHKAEWFITAIVGCVVISMLLWAFCRGVA